MVPADHPLLRVALVVVLLTSGFVALALLPRIVPVGGETRRKLAHLLTGLVATSFAWLFEATWPVALLGGLGLVLALLLRGAPVLRGVVHDVERRSVGDLCMPVVVPLLHWVAMPDRLLYAVPLFVLTLADAAAALGGGRATRWFYRTDEGRKTVAGSLALAAVAAGIVLSALLIDGAALPRALAVAAMVSMLIMLAEATCWRGLDNVVIPLGTYALLRIYLGMPIEQLGPRLLVGVGLVGAAMLWHRRAGLIGAAGIAVALVLYASWALGGRGWLLPPLVVAGLLSTLGARSLDTRDEDHGVGVVLSMALAPLACLFLHAAGIDRAMLPPFVGACAAIVGVVAIVRHRFDRAAGREDPAHAAKIAVAAALVGLGPAVIDGSAAPLALLAVAAIASAAGGFATLASPIERRPATPELRWLGRSAIVAAITLVTLVLPAPPHP